MPPDAMASRRSSPARAAPALALGAEARSSSSRLIVCGNFGARAEATPLGSNCWAELRPGPALSCSTPGTVADGSSWAVRSSASVSLPACVEQVGAPVRHASSTAASSCRNDGFG